jgi:acyl carrier protein
MSDIEMRVKEIVINHLDVKETHITENTNFVNDLGADSLDLVELVMKLETEFNCEIPDDVVEKIVTIKDAINFLETQNQKQGC